MIDALFRQQFILVKFPGEPGTVEVSHLLRHGIDARRLDLAADINRAAIHGITQVLAGIAAHNRDAIADHPECSVSLIREVSGSVAARGGEAGVIVIELRERLERLATHTRERQRTDKALDDARRERRSEIGLAEERRLRGIERIKAMTPESHRRCYDAAMQRLGPNYTTREGWNSDPLTNQVLRANMLHVDHTLRDSGEHGEPNQPDDGPELKYPGTGDSDG